MIITSSLFGSWFFAGNRKAQGIFKLYMIRCEKSEIFSKRCVIDFLADKTD